MMHFVLLWPSWLGRQTHKKLRCSEISGGRGFGSRQQHYNFFNHHFKIKMSYQIFRRGGPDTSAHGWSGGVSMYIEMYLAFDHTAGVISKI